MSKQTELDAKAAALLDSEGAMGVGEPIDRPINCRNALRDEGKGYPKSGCQVCGDGGLRGCPFERNTNPLKPTGGGVPEGFVKKHKLDQVVAAANKFEDVQAETIQRLRDDLRTAHLYQSQDEDRPVWYWQGDGYDHLESLVSDAVVAIRADQLRALLATQQPPEQEQPE